MAAQPAADMESDPLVAAFAQLIATQVAEAQEPVHARLTALERAVREIALARAPEADDLPNYRTEPVGAAGE
jgi:hypothetical protein